MSEFDLMGQVTIGQYLPGDTLVHRLDPRVKLLGASAWMLAAIVSQSLLGLGWGVLLIVLGLVLAQVPLGFAWRGVRAALPFLLLLATLQVLFMPANREGSAFLSWGIITVHIAGLRAAGVLLARFILLICLISLVSFTTTTSGLMHGVEQMLHPLSRLGFPAHEMALTLDIALRSVPLLAQEAERLAKAQASRGGDLGVGKGSIVRRVRGVIPLLVPLFISALGRAERLAVAMEARGYMGGDGRTRYVTLRATRGDWLALALTALAALGVVVF